MVLGQAIRFLFVGILNTAFGYGLYAAALAMGFHYAAAAAIGTILGTLFNFLTSGRIVFGNRDVSRLPIFVSIYVLLYFVNIGVIRCLELIGIDPYLGGLIALVPNTILAFVLQRYVVFRKRDGEVTLMVASIP